MALGICIHRVRTGKGYMRSGAWEKQITVPFHEPEETLRKLTIPEEMGGRQ